MKTLKTFLLLIACCFTFTSCVCETYAQSDDVYSGTYLTVDYATIVTYGTPFIIDNVIQYYLYNNVYYYPYMWDNIWYFHPFMKPQPRGFVFIPDWRHRPMPGLGDRTNRFAHNGFGPHENFGRRQGNMPGIQPRNGFDRSSTRVTVPQNRGGMQNNRTVQTRPNMSSSSRNQGFSTRGGNQMGQQKGGSMSQSRGGNMSGGFRGGRR